MIKRVKYNTIDFEKYKQCLERSVQNADYAKKEFLDTVVEYRWELLVYGDYEAVMPIPLKKKLGVEFVLMPKLCQQLGVFSEKIDEQLNEQFLNFLNRSYLVFFYAFNKDNYFSTTLQAKNSYHLDRDNYDVVKKNYSVHRRRNVRIIGDLVDHLSFQDVGLEACKTFFCDNAKGIENPEQAEIYFQLMKQLCAQGLGSFAVMHYKNEIQSLVFLYQSQQTSYLSLFVNKKELVNSNFPSIMIDHCLQNFIPSRAFDFMGSMVRSVAQFNERFGAKAYSYPILSHSKLTLFKNLLITRF